jgi:asparagine synthase (glutamine-hydrolysing)
LYYLPEDLLMKVDRASMQHSLEVRVPLLDRGVVELAWRLPVHYKYPTGSAIPQYKPLLRAILREFLPASLVERPKWGFALPLRVWMRKGPLRDWIHTMTDSKLLENEWGLSPTLIKNLWRQYDRGREELGTRLWLLSQLGAFTLERRRNRLREPQGLYPR